MDIRVLTDRSGSLFWLDQAVKSLNPQNMKNSLPKILAAAILLSLPLPAFSDEGGWTTHYAQAVEQAKKEDKAILLDFTGSDWCEWCMKMKKETLDTGAFKSYAKQNLVLVEVDFPQNKPQSEALKAQNQKLGQQFGISGYPSFVILNKNGKVLGRQVGYLEGGPAAFLAELKKFYKAPARSAATGGDDFDSFFKTKPGESPAP